MLKRHLTYRMCGFAAALAVAAVAGCKKEEAPAAKPAATAPAKTPAEKPKAPEAAKTPAEHPETADAAKAPTGSPTENDPAVLAILAKADSADGTPDKVVSKCGGCSLRMDGTAANEITVSGYKMRFCSPDCKGRFEKEPAKAILAMNVSGG